MKRPDLKVRLTGEEIIGLLMPEVKRRVALQRRADGPVEYTIRWTIWQERTLPRVDGDELPEGTRPVTYDIEFMLTDGPIDRVLYCPSCSRQHLDIGEFETRLHRTHRCVDTPAGPNTGCGHEWRPFEYATRGVEKIVT